MTEKHEDLDDVVTDEIVEQTLEEMDGKVPAPKEDPDATSPEDAVASVDKVVKDAPPQIKKVHPKTKAGMISAMTDKMLKMSKKDMEEMYDSYSESVDMENSEVVVETTVDTSAELDALVESEATLSEEFKQKTAILFETALKSKLSEEVDRLEAEYVQNLEEEVSQVQSQLVEKVDSYLSYVVENWMKENEVSVVNGLRTEIAEEFMTSLQKVFTEHYIDVPEGKVDLVDDLSEQVAELEGNLNKSTEDNIRLHESVQELERANVIRENSLGLAETEAEKLASLVEDIDFDNKETFEMKVKTVKESYFTKEVNEKADEVKSLIGNDSVETADISDSMARYTQAISKNYS